MSDEDRKSMREADPFSAEWSTAYWRDSLVGEVPLADVVADGCTAVAYGVRDGVMHVIDVYEVEAANSIPPSHSRTFRPAYAKQARRVSYWPLIIVTMIATVTCAGLLGWFVSAALRG